MIEGKQMSSSQIRYVNVISNRSAVRRSVIIAEDSNGLRLSKCRIDHIRYQMCFRMVIFPMCSCCAGGIKVSQGDELHAVGEIVSSQCPLENKFGPSIRIRRLLLMVFVNRNMDWLSVGRARRREYELLHARIKKSPKKRKTQCDIVIKISSGISYRLPNVSKSGKVNARINFVFGANRFDQRSIAYRTFVELDFRSHGVAMTTHQIVDHYDLRLTFTE